MNLPTRRTFRAVRADPGERERNTILFREMKLVGTLPRRYRSVE